jgi:hypothetical protein
LRFSVSISHNASDSPTIVPRLGQNWIDICTGNLNVVGLSMIAYPCPCKALSYNTVGIARIHAMQTVNRQAIANPEA